MSGPIVGMSIETKGISVISPESDTRLNLYLIWRDKFNKSAPDFHQGDDPLRTYLHYNLAYIDPLMLNHLQKETDDRESEYTWYKNDVCQSIAGGNANFEAALAGNENIRPQDMLLLIDVRSQLLEICKDRSFSIKKDGLSTDEVASDYFAYLIASAQFYSGNYDLSLKNYDLLHNSSDRWISETALYMSARSYLNLIQVNAFNEWGDFVGLHVSEHKNAYLAVDKFQKYLEKFPGGNYAKSATGLLRRAYWLANDNEQLLREYNIAGTIASENEYFEKLLPEIDNKVILNEDILANKIHTSEIIASRIFLYLRPSNDFSKFSITSEELLTLIQNKKRELNEIEGLYDLVLGYFYLNVLQEPRTALQIVDDALSDFTSQISLKKEMNSTEFSLNFLRGILLRRLSNDEEENHWKKLLKNNLNQSQMGPVEGWLAEYFILDNRADAIIATGSPVRSSSVRRKLFSNNFSTSALENLSFDESRGVAEREHAQFVLFLRHIFSEQFGEALNYFDRNDNFSSEHTYLYDLEFTSEVPLGIFTTALETEGYDCPTNLMPLLQTLTKNSDDISAQICLAEFYHQHYLMRFSDWKNYRSVTEVYSDLLSRSDLSREQTAYVLYRSILCYKYERFRCDGEPVSVEQRKLWFERLKIEYKDTRWAKALKYYW